MIRRRLVLRWQPPPQPGPALQRPYSTDMFAATPELAGLLFEFLRDSLAS